MNRQRIIGWVLCGAIAACLAASVGIVAVGCDRSDWSDSRVEGSIRSGKRLVDALEAYRREHGAYPDRLEVLTPAHIERIRQPSAGTRTWVYKPMADGNEFVLLFESFAPGRPSCWYLSEQGRWQREPNTP